MKVSPINRSYQAPAMKSGSKTKVVEKAAEKVIDKPNTVLGSFPTVSFSKLWIEKFGPFLPDKNGNLTIPMPGVLIDPIELQGKPVAYACILAQANAKKETEKE